MQRSKVDADVIGCSSAIAACARASRWEASLELLSVLSSRGLRPNAASFTAAAAGLLSAGGQAASMRAHDLLAGSPQEDHKCQDALSLRAQLQLCVHGPCPSSLLLRRVLELLHGRYETSPDAQARRLGEAVVLINELRAHGAAANLLVRRVWGSFLKPFLALKDRSRNGHLAPQDSRVLASVNDLGAFMSSDGLQAASIGGSGAWAQRIGRAEAMAELRLTRGGLPLKPSAKAIAVSVAIDLLGPRCPGQKRWRIYRRIL